MSTGLARITYSVPTSPPTTKTINIHQPKFLYQDLFIGKDIHVTLTGDTETILLPRIDVHIRGEFAPVNDLSLRRQLHNWWQLAQRGNPFRFVFDSTKTVKTTLSGQEVEGQTVLSVTSTTGIVAAQQYVLRSTNRYELVTVNSIGAGTVTISDALGQTFPSGAVFRDQYLWDAIIRDPNQQTPIRDLFDPAIWPGTFEFDLDFFEDLV